MIFEFYDFCVTLFKMINLFDVNKKNKQKIWKQKRGIVFFGGGGKFAKERQQNIPHLLQNDHSFKSLNPNVIWVKYSLLAWGAVSNSNIGFIKQYYYGRTLFIISCFAWLNLPSSPNIIMVKHLLNYVSLIYTELE